MKNKSKLIVTLLCVVCAAFLLTGCGTKEMTAEESGKMFYDIGAHQDADQLKDFLGDDTAEFDDLINGGISDAKDMASDIMSINGLDLSEDQVNEFVDAVLSAMHKLECKEVTVDYEYSDGETVDLQFVVTSIDFEKMCNDIANDLQGKLEEKVSTMDYEDFDYDAIQTEFMNDYMKELTKRLNEYESDGTTQTITYTFNKKEYKDGLISKKQLWVPDSYYNFGKEIGEACIGQ